MTSDFFYIDELVPGVRWDAKYATWDNFVGKPVDGYEVNRIVGTSALCAALRLAQERARAMGFGLLLWDAYRPQRAVDCFLDWSAQPEDGTTKARYYPNIKRSEMIQQGYVAEKSSHSRGSAVDLTLYHFNTGALVPMGGSFDFMDPVSHHGAAGTTQEEAKNRNLLRQIMQSSGFNSYQYEWWHYMLKNEPYPDTYFDFPVAGAAHS